VFLLLFLLVVAVLVRGVLPAAVALLLLLLLRRAGRRAVVAGRILLGRRRRRFFGFSLGLLLAVFLGPWLRGLVLVLHHAEKTVVDRSVLSLWLARFRLGRGNQVGILTAAFFASSGGDAGWWRLGFLGGWGVGL